MTRSRSPLRFLSSRRMRSTRATRITRSTVGGMGRYVISSSRKNWSSSEMQTRKKSKRHHASWK